MQNFPFDIIRLIALELDAADLARFFRVCKRHASISADPKFWERKLKLDFCLLHGNLQPPFIHPPFNKLPSQKRDKYRKKFHDVYLRIQKKYKLPADIVPPAVTLKRDEGTPIKFNLKSNTLVRLFITLERWLYSLHYNTKKYTSPDFSSDPRQKYLRLYQMRCTLAARYKNVEMMLDPEYQRAKEKLRHIEGQYEQQKNKLYNRANEIGKQLMTKIDPIYHEVKVTSADCLQLSSESPPEKSLCTTILKNMKISHGSLFGYYDSDPKSISGLIYAHLDIEGNMHYDCTDNPKRCPFSLKELAKDSRWDERTLEKMYKLPFELDFNYSRNNEFSDSDSDSDFDSASPFDSDLDYQSDDD